MIRGTVNSRLEAVVRLRVRGPAGVEADVDAVVDTGFTSALTLPAGCGDRSGVGPQVRRQSPCSPTGRSGRSTSTRSKSTEAAHGGRSWRGPSARRHFWACGCCPGTGCKSRPCSGWGGGRHYPDPTTPAACIPAGPDDGLLQSLRTRKNQRGREFELGSSGPRLRPPRNVQSGSRAWLGRRQLQGAKQAVRRRLPGADARSGRR